MIGSKGLNPHELAHRWVKDLGTRPDMRILGRIVGVRSTKQSAGIKIGGFCPDIIADYLSKPGAGLVYGNRDRE